MLECLDLHREFGQTRAQAVKSTAQIEDWYVLKGVDQVQGFKFFAEKQIEEDYQRLFENDLAGALDHLEAREITIGTGDDFDLHCLPASPRSHLSRLLPRDDDDRSLATLVEG